MSKVLSLTEFMPCPNGFVHPETYRVYESLECGCIPIVENAYKYYDRLFPNNPFIKVDMWSEAKSMLNGWGNDQFEKKVNPESVVWQNLETEYWKNFLKKTVEEHYKETNSSLSKKIIDNFDQEILNFVQVCPKEMLDKLEHPITKKN